jgi:hypothetical protein
MGISAKVAPFAEKPLPAPEVRQGKADRYGELKRQLQLIDPIQQEADSLKEEIESWHQGGAGDYPVIERGFLWELQLSARRRERTIRNKWKLFNRLRSALGIRGVIGMITIPLGEIDKVIPKSEREAFLQEERAGWRAFTVVPLHPIEPRENKAAA